MTRTFRSAALCLLVAACGGSKGVGPAAKAPEKRAPVKRDALREYDSALRALRLGGPEATERAAERFAEAVELDPSLWEGWYNLGVLYSREGDEGAALDAFDQALKINPDHTPSLLGRAESARRLGRASKARKDYQKALERDPADSLVRLRLASLLRESGDLDGCLKAVREVLRANPADARAYVELGLMYLAAGRDDLAGLVLAKASEMDPKNPLVWNAIALLNLKRGHDQEAFVQFDHASDLDPSFRDARFNKASVLMDAGDYRQAAAELSKVVAANQDDLDAKIALGIAYRGVGEYDRAAETWDDVLKNAPRHPDALWNLVVLAMDFQKKEDRARELLARYLQAAPEDHPRRRDAQTRMSELGNAPASASGGKP